MTHDEARIREFARSYTDAWCSHDPTKVAAHFVPDGTIAINGGDPTEVTEVARSFIDAFPDIQVFRLRSVSSHGRAVPLTSLVRTRCGSPDFSLSGTRVQAVVRANRPGSNANTNRWRSLTVRFERLRRSKQTRCWSPSSPYARRSYAPRLPGGGRSP